MTTWSNIKDIMLTKISQSKKDTFQVITIMWDIENSQPYRNKEWKDGGQGLGRC